MKITNFKTVVDEDNRTQLVKESSRIYKQHENMNSPQKIVDLMKDMYELDKQAVEYVYMIAMNSKNKVLGVYMVSKGTVNASLLSPREIYMVALMIGAVNLIIVHNHPSGDTTPSKEDMNSTKRIKDAGELIGIKLQDHIIIGNDYYSMKEKCTL